MKYRKLGDSDLEVSEISLGSWLTYGVGVEAEKARACLDAAFDVGINFIDTANVYGRGAAETFLGDALKARPRDSYVLATKLYFPMTDTDYGLSRAQVEKQLDASLQRLQTDYVDLYQCHRYDSGHAAGRDDGGADPRRRKRQGAVHRIFGMAGGQDPRGDRPVRFARLREVRVQPAAIFPGLARAGRGGDPALRRRTAFPRSSGRRSARASSPASTIRTSRRLRARARRARKWAASSSG